MSESQPELNETQQMIVDFATRIQNIDEQIQDLKEGRAEILQEAKSEGINSPLLNRAISAIRRAKKAKPSEVAEEELYMVLLENSGVIEPL